MRRNRNSAYLLLLLLVFSAGCKKDEAPSPQPAKSGKAKPAAQPASPVQGQFSSAAKGPAGLDFSRRTDPFKSQAPVVTLTPGGRQSGQPGSTPPAADALPIQSFEVTKFKVAGIIAGLNENRALLIDPNGKGYVVQTGMQIGNANGRISRITATAVEVVERYKESSGRTKSRTIVLTLAKKR